MTQKREDIICPYCKEMSGRKQGMTPSIKYGKRQRYLCRECGRSWY